MESFKQRTSKNWQMRNKLMAVTLLLSEMELYDRQSCETCPYCSAKKKAQPSQYYVPNSTDKSIQDKFKSALNGVENNEQSLREKLQIYSVAQAQLNKAIEKGRLLTVNNYAPVHKKIEKENVWLLQEQL